MLKANLTIEQHDIIKDICDIQIQSLLRISMEQRVKGYLDDIGISVPDKEIEDNVSSLIREFDKLRLRPNKLLSLDSICLSLVKHILFNHDKRFSKGEYGPHKCNLWAKMNVLEMFINNIMS